MHGRVNDLLHLLREYDVNPKRELSSCHPRDLLRTLVGIARYLDVPPWLSQEATDRACQTCFVELSSHRATVTRFVNSPVWMDGWDGKRPRS